MSWLTRRAPLQWLHILSSIFQLKIKITKISWISDNYQGLDKNKYHVSKAPTSVPMLEVVVSSGLSWSFLFPEMEMRHQSSSLNHSAAQLTALLMSLAKASVQLWNTDLHPPGPADTLSHPASAETQTYTQTSAELSCPVDTTKKHKQTSKKQILSVSLISIELIAALPGHYRHWRQLCISWVGYLEAEDFLLQHSGRSWIRFVKLSSGHDNRHEIWQHLQGEVNP